MLRVSFALVGALMLCGAAQAQSMTDVPLRGQSASVFSTASRKILSIHKVHGVAGMKEEIVSCYQKFRKRQTLSRAQECYALHYTAGTLDLEFSKMMGRDLRDDFLKREKTYNWGLGALDKLGYGQDHSTTILAGWVVAAGLE